MNYEQIERLVRLVAETGVAEVEVRQGGMQVRVTRLLAQPAHTVMAAPAGWAAPAAPVGAPVGASPAAPQPPASPDAAEAGLHVITASMVGTFYRRPNPEAPPFAKEGDTVKKGQVLCILEAMKILNEIESDVSGTLVRVYPDDAQPVEFGEKLFAIRPA